MLVAAGKVGTAMLAVGACSLVDSLDGISDGRPLPLTNDGGSDERPTDGGAPPSSDASGDSGDSGGRRLRVFVTSTTATGGAVGGIQNADARCNTLARAAKRDGTFVAWLSTESSSALSRLTATGPWYRYDDVVAVGSREELTRGSITAPIDVDELGAEKVIGGVWTGVTAEGNLGGTCSDWKIQSCFGSCLGLAGKSDTATSAWTAEGSPGCLSNQLRLYCFEN